MSAIYFETAGQVALSGNTQLREARLLVAGEYPAKNLSVTRRDIDSLVAHFSEPIPVKVEHIDSPLDPLGTVRRVWREGDCLMGAISFPESIATFLSERGARKLSVGLRKEPEWRLLEASLTLNPHVPNATLLSENPETQNLQAEIVRLSAELSQQRVDREIARLSQEGRIVPANEAIARELLAADDSAVVTLSDGTNQPVSETFLRFLASTPPLVRFGELGRSARGSTVLNGGASGAAASFEAEDDDFSDEDRELLSRLGVDPKDVRKTMEDEKVRKR